MIDLDYARKKSYGLKYPERAMEQEHDVHQYTSFLILKMNGVTYIPQQ